MCACCFAGFGWRLYAKLGCHKYCCSSVIGFLRGAMRACSQEADAIEKKKKKKKRKTAFPEVGWAGCLALTPAAWVQVHFACAKRGPNQLQQSPVELGMLF